MERNAPYLFKIFWFLNHKNSRQVSVFAQQVNEMQILKLAMYWRT